MFVQLLGAATQLSATIDEGFHITSGYEYLRTGQMRLMDEHVPLAKALFAWPLFFVPDLSPPEQTAGWTEGDLIRVAQTTVLAYRPIDRVIVACRIPVTLLTLLLAATVYRWAADWFSPTAGVFALALLAFDPNVLAHGSLATTDLGATAFIFWAVWAFVRHLEMPRNRGRWWAAALLIGLAQGAKLTALLLLPVLGVIALGDAWKKARGSHLRALLRRTLSYGSMVVVAGLVLWMVYLFEVRPLPDVADGTFPLPAASHLVRWLRLQNNIDYGRESFLLGQNGMAGWWQYFPVAFGLKTPLSTLLLVVVDVGILLLGRRRSVGFDGVSRGVRCAQPDQHDQYRVPSPATYFAVPIRFHLTACDLHITCHTTRSTFCASRFVHCALRIAPILLRRYPTCGPPLPGLL